MENGNRSSTATRKAWPQPRVHPGRDPSAKASLTPSEADENVRLANEGVARSEPAVSEVQPAPTGEEDREKSAAAPTTQTEDETPAEPEAIVEENVPDRAYFEMHQRRRKALLKDCSGVKLLDFHILAMAEWPENFRLVQARRRRDQWLFIMSIMAALFLAGLGSFIPAWTGGAAFGAMTLLGFLLVPDFRRLIIQRPSYRELLLHRRQILKRARQHIQYLEGPAGLAWQCQALGEYNPALRQARFQNLFNYSQDNTLLSHIRTRAHVRLYLMFVLEAERAYDAMHHSYLEAQQEARERGWEPVSAEIDASSQYS
ncbi:MAG: hypothetical protein CL583_09675 [Alteromonadaceae bacterium]|nr:hypothetical protein [Alteromonadaceae bacterium]